jgi:alkaline phosphatase D
MPLEPRRRALLAAALAAGAGPVFVRHALAADRPRFELGVASGFPRPDGMVLWTHLTGPGLPDRVEVHWEIAQDEAFRQVVARGSETAESGWGHSVHAEPTGLSPGRWYWYRFEALGQRSRTGRTRSAPAPGDDAGLRFAIASCQRWDHGHYAAWRHAANEPLDLVLFLGDYIYEYPSPPLAPRAHEGGFCRTLADYRARYATYQRDPHLQAAHAACPWILVWDDHEVENDYAGLLSQRARGDFPAQRAAAYQAYWEHLPFPKAVRPREGTGEWRIYGAHDWGRHARILTLDDRQYRDRQACFNPWRLGKETVSPAACPELADPRRSLLGLAQERWLAESWSTERPWNLLAQQTLMAPYAFTDPAAADGGVRWTDGWDGYPAARQRLLDGIARQRLGGAVVLGGDVHAHHVADLKADAGDPRSATLATEFCGTSITSRPPDAARLENAARFNPHVRWSRVDRRGYVAFELGARQLQARLMGVADVLDPGSAVQELARFAVEAGRPGARRI